MDLGGRRQKCRGTERDFGEGSPGRLPRLSFGSRTHCTPVAAPMMDVKNLISLWLSLFVCSVSLAQPRDPASHVDPLIGTANGGNTFPGAVVPFGMLSWSPENTRGDATRTAAPGGYQYDATRIRGFSLTHLEGTGCAGASGDVPFMPLVGSVSTSPSSDGTNRTYATGFNHANETAQPGYYQVRLQSGVNVELTA